MPIELYFSNQLDQLADKFAEVVTVEGRSRENILEPSTVVVPNANLAKWLQLFLARKLSVAMNVAFDYLETGLWEMLAALDPDRAVRRLQRLDTDGLKILLLHTLGHLAPDDMAFVPLIHYLYDRDGSARSDAAARIWQLSEKLAYLFEEYEFHRTDMLRRWPSTATAATAMEACQRQLYLRLKGLRDQTAAQGAEASPGALFTTMEYADLVFGAIEAADSAPQSLTTGLKGIHFFGLSQISNFHLNLIGRLQAYYHIHIYTMNPCEEFWEDIQTPGEKRWLQRKNVNALAIQETEQEQGELFRTTTNALLAAWGKPGRESVRLLCRLTDYDFNACFTAPRPGGGVLQRIQNDILTLSTLADDGGSPIAQDRSLQIIACPGRYREVETVYNSILHNLQQDDGLQLTDIAILVPDMSAYKPVIDNIFNRRPAQLTYNLVDSCAEIESVYGKAVLALLKLAEGKFTRSDVFNLILNPCFMQKAGITSEKVRIWANWARELNIFHAFDSHSRVNGGYPAGDRFTWQQGLERLRLARIMTSPEGGGATEFDHYQEHVPYADVQSSDQELVEGFCLVIENLHRAAQALGSGRCGGRQWKTRFFDICDGLFTIPDDYRGEATVRQALVKAFDHLALYDGLPAEQAGGAFELTSAVIREFIKANLTAISGGHGNYLTGGVTISALQPMRPIPFRIVYVLGLEEGRFPGKTNPSSLDLRLAQRRIGDITLPERNRYLFLEMLLSVREKLYLSYVSRDLQRDRIQQPCSVLNQLKRYAEENVLPPDHPFQIQQIPLAGSSSRYLAPDALQPWSDILVNGSLADRVIFFRSRGMWETFRQRATVLDRDRTDRFDPDLAVAADLLPARERLKESITLEQLEAFLKNPVRAKIQRHLGLYAEEETIEDMVLQEDEPVFSQFPFDYNVKLKAAGLWFAEYLGAITENTAGEPLDPQAMFDQVYDAARRKSQTPDGAYADIDRLNLFEQVRCMAATLAPMAARMAKAKKLLRAVAVGDPAEMPALAHKGMTIERFDPLAFTITARDCTAGTAQVDVVLHGQRPWLWQDGSGRWHMLILTGSSKNSPREPDKYVLGPLLFYMFCLAGDISGPEFSGDGLTLHVAYQDSIATWPYAIDRETATAYLQELVSDFLDQSLIAWLPFETVTLRDLPARPHLEAADSAKAMAKTAYALALREHLAEEDDYLIRMVAPVVPDDAYDRVQRRFKIFVPQEVR